MGGTLLIPSPAGAQGHPSLSLPSASSFLRPSRVRGQASDDQAARSLTGGEASLVCVWGGQLLSLLLPLPRALAGVWPAGLEICRRSSHAHDHCLKIKEKGQG